MSGPKIAITVIQVLASMFLICVVLLQSGKNAGLSGTIAGVADTFMQRNQAKTWDAKLARITKWVAFIFIAFTFVLNLI